MELKTPLLTQVRRCVLNTLPVLVRLAAHRRDWLRDPEEWRPDLSRAPRDLLVSLIEFLLADYALPRFCVNAWFIDGPLAHIEREWYCHIGKGGSLRTFHGWMPRLSRRAAHEFSSAPDHFQMREALRFGQAHSILKDRELSLSVAKGRIGLDFHHDMVWIPIFGMWANSDRDHGEFHLVADYVWALTRERGLKGTRLSGRNFPSLVRSAKHFFEALAETVPNPVEVPGRGRIPTPSERNALLNGRFCRWDPLDDVDPYKVEKDGWRYVVRELNSAAELISEGEDMSHCAGGYTSRCRSGASSIFSLRSCDLADGVFDREVTLEVSRSPRRLLQARAWRNRLPHPATRRVILDWCRKNGIDAWSLLR